MFSWDETELVQFFGVLPRETDEFGRNLEFEVHSGGVSLNFGVNVDSSGCSIVFHSGSINEPFFRAVYLDSPGARVVNDKRGSFIEVGAQGLVLGDYDAAQSLGSGLRIWLEPRLLVETFGA